LKRESRHYGSPNAAIVGPRKSALTDAWRTTKLADLCSDFEHRDHVQLRDQLATMTGIVAAAVATYGDSQHNILEIDRIYAELRRNLWAHMFREEHGLYSSIGNVELHRLEPFRSHGILSGAIRAMRWEHRQFAKVFRQIAALLRDYEMPANAGQKYRALVHGFRDLEANKLQHMRKEEIVYSRALALEKESMAR
jgi:iron-sulfur cluster repair protein YtfE (RIC family)